MDYDEDEYFDNGMGFQFNNNNNNNFIPPVTPPPMYTMPAESTFPNRTNTIPVNNENSIPGQPAYTPTVASQPGYGLGFPPSASPNKPLAETPRERSIHSSNHGGEMRTPLRSNVGADPSITNRFFNGPTPKRASPSVPTNNTLYTSLNMSRASSSREPVVPASMLGAPGANPYYMFDNNNNNNNSMPPPPQQPTPSPVRVANTSDNSLNSGARNTNNNNNEALEQPYNVSVPPHTATVPPPPEALQVHRTPVNQSHTSSSNAHSGYVNSPSAVSSIHHPTDRLAVVTPAQNSSFASSNTASTTPSKFIYPRSAQRPPIILRHEVPQEDVPPARTPFLLPNGPQLRPLLFELSCVREQLERLEGDPHFLDVALYQLQEALAPWASQCGEVHYFTLSVDRTCARFICLGGLHSKTLRVLAGHSLERVMARQHDTNLLQFVEVTKPLVEVEGVTYGGGSFLSTKVLLNCSMKDVVTVNLSVFLTSPYFVLSAN